MSYLDFELKFTKISAAKMQILRQVLVGVISETSITLNFTLYFETSGLFFIHRVAKYVVYEFSGHREGAKKSNYMPRSYIHFVLYFNSGTPISP